MKAGLVQKVLREAILVTQSFFLLWVLILTEDYGFLILAGCCLGLILLADRVQKLKRWKNLIVGFLVRTPPLAIVGLAFLLRLVVAFSLRPEPISDYIGYWNSAIRFAEGYSFLPRSPLTTITYGLGVWIFGNHLKWMYVFNAILSGLQVWLVYNIAKSLGGARSGLLSALIVAVFPSLVFYAGVVSSETLLGVTVLLYLYILIRIDALSMLLSKDAILWGVVLGCLIFLCYTSRSIGLIIGFALLLTWGVLSKVHWNVKTVFVCTAFISFLFCSLPVFLYNYVTYRVMSLDTYIAGDSWRPILMGTNYEANGVYNDEDIALVNAIVPPSRDPEAQIKRFEVANQIARERVLADPLRFLVFGLTTKLDVLWTTDGYGMYWAYAGSPEFKGDYPDKVWDWINLSNRFYLVVLALALLGWVKYRNGGVIGLYLTAMVILCVAGVHLVLEVQERYHYVAQFALAILAGGVLWAEKSRDVVGGERGKEKDRSG